jgi:excisionase family DNA binding protein
MSESPLDLLIATEVARWLRLSRSTVYAWAATGRIPSVTSNDSVRFIRADIERWITTQVNHLADAPPSRGCSLIPHQPASVSRLMIQQAGARAIQRIKNRSGLLPNAKNPPPLPKRKSTP